MSECREEAFGALMVGQRQSCPFVGVLLLLTLCACWIPWWNARAVCPQLEMMRWCGINQHTIVFGTYDLVIVVHYTCDCADVCSNSSEMLEEASVPTDIIINRVNKQTISILFIVLFACTQHKPYKHIYIPSIKLCSSVKLDSNDLTVDKCSMAIMIKHEKYSTPTIWHTTRALKCKLTGWVSNTHRHTSTGITCAQWQWQWQWIFDFWSSVGTILCSGILLILYTFSMSSVRYRDFIYGRLAIELF